MTTALLLCGIPALIVAAAFGYGVGVSHGRDRRVGELEDARERGWQDGYAAGRIDGREAGYSECVADRVRLRNGMADFLANAGRG